ncbi:MAG: aldehyde ferredoxin oxidoreductase family protein [Chloroflexi bacterium]|nr:aldehyde ferredoxin oxidoreductase family protein [Chloroflexota bacterium]
MFPYRAYAGRWLRIDLSTRRIEVHDTDRAIAEGYLGGNGWGARMLWENVARDVDPLDPGNLLMISTGPMCGTLLPNSGRVEVIAKSPLTGIYGDANAGGFFGPELKFAGWDAVMVVGRSDRPVILAIDGDTVALQDATGLWGRTTSETESEIRQAWRDPRVKVASIGPAGENLVRFASIQMTPQRSAGRCGLGAVMGSKHLKAVAVRGYGSVSIADPERFHSVAVEMHHKIRTDPVFAAVSRFGTPGIVTLMDPLGRFPTKNYQMGSFDDVERIGAEALHDRAFVRHLACFGCPVGCDKLYCLRGGAFDGTCLRSVEYETLNSMGANVLNADLDAILAANRFCDDMGLDTISAGRAISFAMELWQEELINLEDTGGLAFNWGDMTTVRSTLEAIVRREGFGAVLAEGVRRAAEIIGRGSEQYAMHVKGMEIAAQDGRAQKSMGLAHATSNRGADHLKAFPVIDETGFPDEGRRRYGEEYLPEIVDPLETKYKPFLVKDGEDFGAVIDSVGVCKSGGSFVLAEVYWDDIAAALESGTGMSMPTERLKQIGERIYNLQRCYNVWHGISRADDRLPKRFTEEPSPSGNARGQVVELERMLDEYYHLREWDAETGWPTARKLQELGLSDAVKRLGL